MAKTTVMQITNQSFKVFFIIYLVPLQTVEANGSPELCWASLGNRWGFSRTVTRCMLARRSLCTVNKKGNP